MLRHLLLGSGFSHHLELPDWYSTIEYNSSALFCPVRPPHLTPTLSIHKPFHLVFCLPLHLFPGTGASNILLSTCPSSLLLTCPYNFSLFSVIFFVTGATFTDPLTCSFHICDPSSRNQSHVGRVCFPLWAEMHGRGHITDSCFIAFITSKIC